MIVSLILVGILASRIITILVWTAENQTFISNFLFALLSLSPSFHQPLRFHQFVFTSQNYLEEFTSQNVRPDGMPFSASRPITVLPSIFSGSSYGSAMATLGGGGGSNICAIVVCTLSVGHPNPSAPNDGNVDSESFERTEV